MPRDQASSAGKMRTRRSLRSEESDASPPQVTPPSNGTKPTQPLQECAGASNGIKTPLVVLTDQDFATPNAPQKTIPSSDYGMVVVMPNPQILDNIVEVNEEFDMWMVSHPELKHLKNKFFVCDGNHRLLAWYSHIATKHKNKRKWTVPM